MKTALQQKCVNQMPKAKTIMYFLISYWQKQPPEMFCKKKKNSFAKLTEEHLRQSLLFNKIAGFSMQLY